MINKNKEEIERIKKGCGNKWNDEDGDYSECGEEDYELCPSCKSKLQERIKTSIEWCEDEIEFLLNLDEKMTNFENKGFCDNEDEFDSILGIIGTKINDFEDHLKWLKEKRGQEND